MALFWYRRNVFKKFDDDDSQIMQFLLGIKRVYPGYANGELQEGLTLKEIDSLLLSVEGHAVLLLLAERPRFDDNVNEVINDFDIETAIQNDSSSLKSNSNGSFWSKNYLTHVEKKKLSYYWLRWKLNFYTWNNN